MEILFFYSYKISRHLVFNDDAVGMHFTCSHVLVLGKVVSCEDCCAVWPSGANQFGARQLIDRNKGNRARKSLKRKIASRMNFGLDC